MSTRKGIAIATIVFFLLSGISGSWPLLGAGGESEETAKLVREADEAYQNGDFKLAIEKYQKAMQLISEKKELAQTKQELFQTMTSLALTYFTIQENAKARKQLEDLVLVNPKYELDPEYFPPKFIDIFRGVQHDFLGRLTVTSAPPGAAVTLGNSELGAAPLTVEKVLKGKYELRAELKGFAPVRKEIIVQAAVENREELLLEAEKPLVEKSQPPQAAKKKRTLSPLILVGGAAAAVAVAAILLTGKKDEPAKVLKSMIFSNTDAVPIDMVLPSYVPLNASDVPARIQKVEYRVVVYHPNHMEDLNINVVGTDSQTLFNIWNRNQSSLATTIIAGSTEAFNAVAPNGTWRLVVQNQGRNPGGEIREFTLRIYYYQ